MSIPKLLWVTHILQIVTLENNYSLLYNFNFLKITFFYVHPKNSTDIFSCNIAIENNRFRHKQCFILLTGLTFYHIKFVYIIKYFFSRQVGDSRRYISLHSAKHDYFGVRYNLLDFETFKILQKAYFRFFALNYITMRSLEVPLNFNDLWENHCWINFQWLTSDKKR